ncbi:MAG: alpha/beta fold hydrolase [Rhizonema sp. PD37]|nr:alpha/beta fold hydrolase [Rhizonema sp. PD37]
MTAIKLQYLIKFLIWVSAAVALIYSVICIFLFFEQSKFIFFPSSIIETTPSAFNLQYEEIWVPVCVGKGRVEHIHGWWIEASSPNAKVVLYLHGNGINIGANVERANRFHKLGFSVLLIDYRGYGRSEGGFPQETSVYQDAEAIWNYLIQLHIPPNQIFIYGHSLGGAIAINLALEHPDAAGLIVESSFTSIRELITYRNNFWMFPVDLILIQRFESIKKVPNLKMPVLFIHGMADFIVPTNMSQSLYDLAHEPKKLLFVPGAGHNNVAELEPVKYQQVIQSFVNSISISHKD